jgi:hypothetical protein
MKQEKLTQEQFALSVGVSQAQISRLVRDGLINLSDGLAISNAKYCQILRDRISEQDAEGSTTLAAQKIRHEKIKADRAELEFQKAQGKLIPVELAASMYGELILNSKAKILALPKLVPVKYRDKLNAGIIQALNELVASG